MNLREIICVVKTVALIALFILASALSAHAQKPATSAGASPIWNNNSLIDIQKNGDAARPGEVKLEFYGHDAFKITSPDGLTVLVDPWRNDPTGSYPKWFLDQFPALRVDIVLSTHAHFDHDAVDLPNGLMVLERLVGQFKLGDIEITGLADKHQCQSTSDYTSGLRDETCPPNNVIGFDNAIQIIATGGLRIAIWGDNRAVPDPSLDHYLKDVDVLILPVDTVLTRPEVNAITRKYDPKAIIPAHYFIDGLTTNGSGLESADGWVNDQEKTHHADVRRLNRADLTLKPAELKASHHRIYYFGNHFEKK
ncbi:MAG TPA: MBL fold metallo-hydrolase [Pseudacidobacterium sp.]|jgi:L-ascorbate metabolism protein UlaG (beta-lactamase superfamily)|nr:MBL fold metallo-hydrolase [Pseudacidobacterium sp.]